MEIIEKKAGYTINQLIEKYKKDNNIKKACFCGRLDPMARGKVLILIEENCKLVNNYLKMNKTYQFEICFGFQTDTDDFLGIIENKTNEKFNNIEYISQYIKKITGKDITQKFHNFSTKNFVSKKLNNDNYHNVKILKSKILGYNRYIFKNFINNIIENINTIDKNKNFRQNEIINQWKQIDIDYIYSLKVELSVTSGFYIRQFVRNLSDVFSFPFITHDINRTNIFIH